tara:strand:- start:126 stop:737 length:612 start_codon:yes stop_codon:yes gene_type:complete
MKRLVALMMCAVGLCAAAQFPNLPYNPDENGDGLIGVVDLQGLLSNYGNDFSAAILNDDSTIAILDQGIGTYVSCRTTCASLPGSWSLVDIESAGNILDQMGGVTYAWCGIPGDPGNISLVNALGNLFPNQTTGLQSNWRCFCQAKQLHRVAIFTCTSSCDDGIEALDACVNEKAAQGWYPMEQSQQQVNNICFWQPMWRWAE